MNWVGGKFSLAVAYFARNDCVSRIGVSRAYTGLQPMIACLVLVCHVHTQVSSHVDLLLAKERLLLSFKLEALIQQDSYDQNIQLCLAILLNGQILFRIVVKNESKRIENQARCCIQKDCWKTLMTQKII